MKNKDKTNKIKKIILKKKKEKNIEKEILEEIEARKKYEYKLLK